MNIVLLSLDTVRRDTLFKLVDNGELPNIGEIVASGHQYTNAKANGPWTVPSHGSLFTGQYPSSHGVSGADPYYSENPLVSSMADQGFTTVGISANPWLSEAFNFDEEFDYFFDNYTYSHQGATMTSVMGHADGVLNGLSRISAELFNSPSIYTLGNIAYWWYCQVFSSDDGAKRMVSRATKSLNGGRNFVFLNLMEAHLPYRIPNEYLDDSTEDITLINQSTSDYNAGLSNLQEESFVKLKARYENCIRYIDSVIGMLIEEIPEETYIIIIGDHGEHFGEHGRFGHQYSLYNELLNVPLIVSGPGIDSKVIEEPVELRKLADFIPRLANGETNPIVGSEQPIAEVICPTPDYDALRKKSDTATPRDFVSKYNSGARCISMKDFKLIEFSDGRHEVVEVKGDKIPEESEIKSAINRLQDVLGDPSDSSENSDLSTGVENRLEELGYI